MRACCVFVCVSVSGCVVSSGFGPPEDELPPSTIGVDGEEATATLVFAQQRSDGEAFVTGKRRLLFASSGDVDVVVVLDALSSGPLQPFGAPDVFVAVNDQGFNALRGDVVVEEAGDAIGERIAVSVDGTFIDECGRERIDVQASITAVLVEVDDVVVAAEGPAVGHIVTRFTLDDEERDWVAPVNALTDAFGEVLYEEDAWDAVSLPLCGVSFELYVRAAAAAGEYVFSDGDADLLVKLTDDEGELEHVLRADVSSTLTLEETPGVELGSARTFVAAGGDPLVEVDETLVRAVPNGKQLTFETATIHAILGR